ncbi:WhiB family transcriptional regulator [Longimycelium tulufanense]|uniref:WhiB family transcriptional regulator n=1 Tax=Longimycelium tulufanense TaxID=907463 RepID=UPI003570D037
MAAPDPPAPRPKATACCAAGAGAVGGMSAATQHRPAVGGEEWWAYIACAGVPEHVFFPGPGRSARTAREICGRCPVRAQCLEEVLRLRPRTGIWAGLTQPQLQELYRRRDQRRTASRR